MLAWRWLLAVGLVTLLAFAGWRIWGQMQAERDAATAPQRALAWRPADPDGLLAVAEQRLQQRDFTGAKIAARRLLQVEPLQGRAFRVLAEVAAARGDASSALRLYSIAAARAPRDTRAHAWLAQRYLERGDFAAALAHIDRILRVDPVRISAVAPVLVKLATDRRFAEALAQTLRQAPPWQDGMLRALLDPVKGDPGAAGYVLGALLHEGALSATDRARWLDGLIARGRWGEAYARWVGMLPILPQRLPLLYNGDFGQVPGSGGFDWRVRRVPGVLVAFEPVAGSSGPAAYLRFLGRRVGATGLEHPLLLAPGRYRLALRMRAQALHSEDGLQWQLACAGPINVIARSEPIDGSFGWRQQRLDFDIPAQGCPGQWLRLVNPIPDGAAQAVGGEIWVDDVHIKAA
jgi:tetratricopeptide (TPR) repeat protein